MSAALIALLFSAGFSVWVFTKLQGQTTGNSNALKGAGVVFVLAFIVVFTIARATLHN